jgi:hypothetical protein
MTKDRKIKECNKLKNELTKKNERRRVPQVDGLKVNSNKFSERIDKAYNYQKNKKLYGLL